MNGRPTPETDQFKIKLKTTCGEKYWVPVEHSERLERERDEARKGLDEIRAERDLARLSSMESDQAHDRMVGELEKVYQERDKLNTDLVEISNKLVVAMRERDEAREALLKIEDRCVDCEDACDDIQKIREIAVKALEEAK